MSFSEEQPTPRSAPAEGGKDVLRAPDANVKMDQFVRLLTQNQRRISVYVLGMVPHWNDAEEIIQETNLILWREFEHFELGTNFAAWACRVAFHQVLAWRKRKSRQRLYFSPAFLDAVSEQSITAADYLETRSQFLANCLDKLPAGQRELIRMRYTEHCSLEELSRRSGRTVGALYRALSRIRRALHDCVSRAFAVEDET